ALPARALVPGRAGRGHPSAEQPAGAGHRGRGRQRALARSRARPDRLGGPGVPRAPARGPRSECMTTLLRRIGLRHLTAQPLRSVLVLFAVALGVTMLAAVQLINASTRRAFGEAIDEVAGRANLQVIGPESGFPDSVRDTVRGVAGVDTAVPLVF